MASKRDRVVDEPDQSDIPPALTATEWANIARLSDDHRRLFVNAAQDADRPHAVIAMLNDALHDEDPRKLTPEQIALLRYVAGTVETLLTVPIRDMSLSVAAQDALDWSERYSQLLELADVLASYLPPEA
jgi:hypothetical protein